MSADRRLPAATLQRQLGPWRDRSAGNIGRTVAEQIRQLITDGRLPVHVKLPAERDLAREMALSRTTVAGIYTRLRETGFLESRQGSGSWTAMPDTVGRGNVTPWLPGGSTSIVDFSHAALSAVEPFMSDAVGRATLDLPRYYAGHGYHVHGLPVLRAAIAQRFTDRGLPTTAEEILITNGAQQGINLVLETLVQPSSRIMVDHPTYPGALDAIRRRSARAVPIGFDDSVWNIDAMNESVRHAAPQLMYLVPDCHNPTGLSMPVMDRPSVVELAERTALPVIIDETLSELVLDGEDLPPLASFGSARHSMLVTIGSASKLFWGGLRVGWIRAPREVITQLAGTRAVVDMAGPVLDQLIVASLLEHVEEIRSSRRTSLTVARRELVDSVTEFLPDFSVGASVGGLNLWIDLGAPLAGAFCRAAAQTGIQITPGSRFGVDGAFENFIRLPFTLEPHLASEAIERLGDVWDTLRADGARAYPLNVAV